MLIFLVACVPPVSITPVSNGANPLPTVQANKQSVFTPTLVSEWTLGSLEDITWSPDGKTFVANYWIDNSDTNNFVEAFSIESFSSMWIAKGSLASSLVFTPDGQYVVESNTHIPLFYWRDIEQGKVVHMGELTDMSQTKKIECTGGGQMMIQNVKGNFAVLADYNMLIGLNGPSMVFIRQLNLETGKCKELFNYEGSFDLFDSNSSGTLLAYGGIGKDDFVAIRNLDKNLEVCRIPKVEFGRFVSGENTLAVVRDQKIVFIDALTCKEIRKLSISPLSGYETYFAFSPNGQEFAIAKDAIQVLNVSTGDILARILFPLDAGPISKGFFWNGIKFSPDGRYLLITYAISNGNKVQLWQLKQ